MIRIASAGVILLAGVLALGAFFLARGSETQAIEATIEATTTPEPAAAIELPQAEKLYFLRGIDLEGDTVAVVLFNAGPAPLSDPLIVRNQAAIRAAQDTAFVAKSGANGQPAGSFVLALTGVVPEDTIAQIYRDDVLIGTVSCPKTVCGGFADSPDLDLAGLIAAATPIQRVSDQFGTYDAYIATIDAISRDPDFMFLHARPQTDFPAERDLPTMDIQFPTVIAAATSPFDVAAHQILISTILAPVLPEGARLRDVTINDIGPGVVADGDSRAPVLAGGAPIPYPGVRYFEVMATIDGAATLDRTVLDTLTQQTRSQFDFSADFDAFIRDRLQSDCADCFWLLPNGEFHDDARILRSDPETYSLDYFDLRDTP